MSNVDVNALTELVRRVLTAWTGYQLALVNQSAGQETGAFNDMLHSELTSMLAEYDVEKYDVEDWLTDAFSESFNLVLEDGSVQEMSQLLAESAKLIKANRMEEAEQLVRRLPDVATVEAATRHSKTVEDDDSESDEDEDQVVREVQPKTREPRMETDEDGWTTVLPRQK